MELKNKNKISNSDNREVIILSLGGSLIVPDDVDTNFLKNFKKLLSNHIKDKRFIIICGGGRICRKYNNWATDVNPKISDDSKHWIGIMATRLNGMLVKSVLENDFDVHNEIITNPKDMINFSEDIMVCAGYLPGWSTDYDAVLLAEKFNVKDVINMSNIDFVYDKDPRTNKNAKPIKDLLWNDFFIQFGTTFDPGQNVPFDPIAAKLAQKNNIKVMIINGNNLDNLNKLLYGELFDGTIIM
jgi:uridylate kinase